MQFSTNRDKEDTFLRNLNVMSDSSENKGVSLKMQNFNVTKEVFQG